jgi:hypothetical protein
MLCGAVWSGRCVLADRMVDASGCFETSVYAPNYITHIPECNSLRSYCTERVKSRMTDFEILTGLTIKTTVLRHVTPCSVIDGC